MAQNVGIVGWNMYTPGMYVSQEELEKFDGIPAGKYTKGLGQLKVCAASSIACFSVRSLPGRKYVR